MPIVSDIPGKIFVAGEYAVLSGGRAVVAATAPRFALTTDPSQGVAVSSMHPLSPVGRLMARLTDAERASVWPYFVHDPLQGAGGFGASTAQFALLLDRFFPNLTAKEAWKLYQSFHAQDPVPPSGADLFAQWQGGIQLWWGEGGGHRLRLHSDRDFELAVIAAGHQASRKVATHEHLPRLEEIRAGKAEWIPELNSKVERVIQWIETQRGQALGAALTSVGQVLNHQGLEIPETSRDLLSLRSLPGVWGAKGAGAMQADALIAVVQRDQLSRVPEWCSSRNLKFLGWLNDELAGIRHLT